MRRYGVRFGAYHIFLPALLKPAPAELVTLLWALKNDGLGNAGYGDLIPVLAAGRTSVVTDPSFDRMFYKLAGFRFLGKRAVRIDILERLADIIRPLLQWKPGAQPRPEGAYDGRRFTTTTGMLSILGATLDDMEEILKGLGYRADQVSAEDAATFLAGQSGQTAASTEAPVGEDAGDEHDADAAEHEVSAEETKAVVEEAVASAEAPQSSEASAETAEPKPVLLWRPGGRNENQRNDNRRQGHGQSRGQGERRNEGGEGRDRNRAAAGRDGNRENNRDGERKRDGGQRPDRGNRNDRGERKDKHDRNDRGGKPQSQRFESKPPRKEKPLDPDSPFAKLAALKEQMKK
jgi:ATP-dependent RNA helicase SUPV3L1/SUV3